MCDEVVTSFEFRGTSAEFVWQPRQNGWLASGPAPSAGVCGVVKNFNPSSSAWRSPAVALGKISPLRSLSSRGKPPTTPNLSRGMRSTGRKMPCAHPSPESRGTEHIKTPSDIQVVRAPESFRMPIASLDFRRRPRGVRYSPTPISHLERLPPPQDCGRCLRPVHEQAGCERGQER